MRPEQQHPSRYQLDLYARGEGDQGAAIADHLQACRRCASYLEQADSVEARFRRRFPDRSTFEAHRSAIADDASRSPVPTTCGHGLGSAGRRWRLALFGAVAAAAVGALVIVLSPSRLTLDSRVEPLAGQSGSGGGRIKGRSVIELMVTRGETTFRYRGQPLLPDDRVTCYYTSTKPYLLLVGLEASGSVNVFIADAEQRQSRAISPGQARLLPEAVELDDYRGREMWVALFSDHPLQVQRVQSLLRQWWSAANAVARESLSLGRLPIAAEQQVWNIRKRRAQGSR